MIIVVSDVHLGYDESEKYKCDKDNFNNFIDSELTKLKANDHLVLLGDILDFWRKNCVEATVEYEYERDRSTGDVTPTEGLIMKKLYDLTKKPMFTTLLETMTIQYSIFLKESTTFLFMYLEICICLWTAAVRNFTLSMDMNLKYSPILHL
jgi:UDP-2,3-diacylglucosamine pyrophosphatase LpxH